MSLSVTCPDGAVLAVPESALVESRVLRDLYNECGEGEEAPLLGPVCLSADLRLVFGLCPAEGCSARLSWTTEAEFAEATRAAHCAHYLDMPRLLAAVANDFAEALLKAPSLSAAAARFHAPPWSLEPRRSWPEGMEAAAQRLLFDRGRISCLGTRAQIFAATWACSESPLYALPEEFSRAVLEQAEILCEAEFGSAFELLEPKDRKGRPEDTEKAFAIIESRREQLLNSPLAISVAVTWALAPTSRALTRAAALKALRAICTFGDAEAFASFFRIVDPATTARKHDEEIEAVAFEALPIVVAMDNEQDVQAVVDAASASILHPTPRVRAAAVACLGAVARDPPAVFRYLARSSGLDVFTDCDLSARSLEEALEGSLHNEDPRVRLAGAEAIGLFTVKAGAEAGERLLQRLTGLDGAVTAALPELRQVGLVAVKHLMVAADIPGGWDVLASRLQDPHEEVRNSARVAIAELTTRDDGGASAERIMPLLPRGAHDLPDAVRAMPLEVAAAIARHSTLRDKAAWSAKQLAVSALIDEAPAVRVAALQLLRYLGSPCDALDTIVSLLCDGHGDVRMEASRALAELAPRGDADVAAAVAAALAAAGPETEAVELAGILKTLTNGRRDAASATALAALDIQRSEVSCRVAALRGLEAVAPMGHEAARATALRGVRSSSHLEVQMAAVATLQSVCHPGDAEAVAAILDIVVGQEHVLRPLAVSALAVLSAPGDIAVIDAIRQRLDHGHWPVRAAALQAFAALAPVGCPESVAAVGPRLRDSNMDVRQIAAGVLVSLASGLEADVCALLAQDIDTQPARVQLTIEDAIDQLSQGTKILWWQPPDDKLDFDFMAPATHDKAAAASSAAPTGPDGDAGCARRPDEPGVSTGSEAAASRSGTDAVAEATDGASGAPQAPSLQCFRPRPRTLEDGEGLDSATAATGAQPTQRPLEPTSGPCSSATPCAAATLAPEALETTASAPAAAQLRSPTAAMSPAGKAGPQLRASLRAFLEKKAGVGGTRRERLRGAAAGTGLAAS